MKRARKAITGTVAAIKSQAGAVAASFALPSDFAPFRMRNEYTTEETALFHTMEEHQSSFNAVTSGSEQCPATQHVEFIFQDLLRNRISYVRNPTSATWQYTWCFGRSTNSNNQNGYSILAGQDEFLVPTHGFATSTFQPHGSIYFAENDNGITGLWVDATSAGATTISAVPTSTPSSTTGNVTLFRWNNGNWIETTQLPITSGTATYNFTNIQTSGVYALKVTGHANGLTWTASSSGNCGCWGHFCAPYVLTNADSIESARTLGHSILVKNFTAPLYQDGDITAVQPGKARVWTSFTGSATLDPFSIVRDYAGAENTKPLKTGLYGFVKPTEEADLSLREPFVIVPRASGGSADTVWTAARTPILNTTYIVVAMATSNYANANIVVRTDTSGEFETGNQFFNIDKPRAEPQEWRDGMEALASMQQFYENPTHWKKILSTIGSVASVGGRILSLFGPKGAAIGVPMGMAGDILKGGFQ